MSLTQQQMVRVGEWFKDRGVRGACPYCSNKRWTIVGMVAAPVSTALGVETHGGPSLQAHSVPAVATSCNECGYTMLFSAVMMGLR